MIADDLGKVRVRSKADSRLMLFLALLLGPRFLRTAWTTLSKRTIWAPIWVDLAHLEPHATVIRHELVHVRQVRRWWLFWHLSYVLLPLPVGLAWCRWRWEREAYLGDIRAGRMTIDQVVEVLWWRYAFPWRRAWMRRWFWREAYA